MIEGPRVPMADEAEALFNLRPNLRPLSSYDAALACWRSPEYQAAMKIRVPISTADLVIAEGYEGAQPGG